MATLRTPAQSRAIWALAGRLPLDRDGREDVVRQTCMAASSQEHTSRLSPVQAQQVIKALEARVVPAPKPVAVPNGRAPWGTRGPGRRDDQPITPDQQKTIGALFTQAGFDTPERRRAFAERQCKQPWPQTQKDADSIIEALSAMIVRAAGDVEARVRAVASHPALDDWKRRWAADVLDQFARAKDSRARGRVPTPAKIAKLAELERVCQ